MFVPLRNTFDIASSKFVSKYQLGLDISGVLLGLLILDEEDIANRFNSPFSATNLLRLYGANIDNVKEILLNNSRYNNDNNIRKAFEAVNAIRGVIQASIDQITNQFPQAVFTVQQTGYLFYKILRAETSLIPLNLLEGAKVAYIELGQYFNDEEFVDKLSRLYEEIIQRTSYTMPRYSPQAARPEEQSSSSLIEEFINNFTEDFVEMARQGKLDPLIGRQKELNRIIHILCRRRKNNPVLIGPAGVGKTAIVEGLAQAIARGEVPEPLRDKRILSVNMGSLIAGTRLRGDLEERLKVLIEYAKQNPVILFIDEIHTLNNDHDISPMDILKPALSRGEIRLIGATTFDEYKIIERDKAFERRVQPVFIEENTTEETIEIIKNLSPLYESYHGVKYEEEALKAAIDLSTKYIIDRAQPDKALDVIDEAGAKAKLNNQTVIDKKLIADIVSSISNVPVNQVEQDDITKLAEFEQFIRSKIVGQEEAISAVVHGVKRNRIKIGNKNKPISFIFLGPTGVGKTEIARRMAEFMFGSKDALLRLDMAEYMHDHEVSKIIGSPPGYVGYGDVNFLDYVKRRPYSIILLDEIEKAHPRVLDMFLHILDEGFAKDGEGRKVSFANTIIIMTSNIGTAGLMKQTVKKKIGFRTSEQNIQPAQMNYETMKKQILKQLENQLRPEFINRIDYKIVFHPLTQEHIAQIVRIQLGEFVESILKDYNLVLIFNDDTIKHLAALAYADNKYGARPVRRIIETNVIDPIIDNICNGYIKPGDVVRFVIVDSGLAMEIEHEEALVTDTVPVQE